MIKKKRSPTLKERLEQIRKGGKYRLKNNSRLKKLALRTKTTGEQSYE